MLTGHERRKELEGTPMTRRRRDVSILQLANYSKKLVTTLRPLITELCLTVKAFFISASLSSGQWHSLYM